MALARVALLVARLAERHLAPLSVGQYLALDAIARGGPAARDLARAAGVSPAAMSQVLGHLEAIGLIRRERDPADRRRQRLAPTAAGRRALDGAHRRLAERLEALLFSLGPRERDALARALPPLADAAAGAAPPRPTRRPDPPRPRP